jgi:hypothetical protein
MAIKSRYRGIVQKGVVASMAAGPLGAVTGPFDATAVFAIWSTMLIAIARESGHKLDGTFVTKFLSTVGSAAIAYYGGCKAATWLFNLVPGAGTLVAIGASTAMNAVFTYKFGAAVSNLFDKDDFDLKDAFKAAKAVISLLCTFPTISEVEDLLDIKDAVA